MNRNLWPGFEGSRTLAPSRAGTGGVKQPDWQHVWTSLSLWESRFCLAERLVGTEANDGQSEGVNGQLIVLHTFAEDIGNAGCPSLPLELGMIRRIRVHPLKLNPSRIRRLPEVVKNDVLDLYVDVRKGRIFDVGLDDVVFALLLDDGPLHVAIEEVQGIGLIAFDSEAIAEK